MRFCAMVSLAAAILCGQTHAATEKLVNGGFETSDATGWTLGAYGSASVLPSGTYGVTAAEGSYFVSGELTQYDRWPRTVLAQTVGAPMDDAWYEITGWVYLHASGDTGAKKAGIAVDWGDGTVERAAGALYDSWNWIDVVHYAGFDSPSPLTLTLEVYGDPLELGDFVLYDGFSVTEYPPSVPEPGALQATAALTGPLAILLHRRRDGRC